MLVIYTKPCPEHHGGSGSYERHPMKYLQTLSENFVVRSCFSLPKLSSASPKRVLVVKPKHEKNDTTLPQLHSTFSAHMTDCS